MPHHVLVWSELAS